MLEKLNGNNYKAIFFVNDTGGKYHEAVENLYQIAYAYHSTGIDTYILHEKEDFNIPNGLSPKFAELNHVSFAKMSSSQMMISHEDFIFIPDVYLEFVSQLKEQGVPAEFIIIVQNINVSFDMLEMGQTFYQLGVRQVIVTDDYYKRYFESYFSLSVVPASNTIFHVITPYVDDVYPYEHDIETNPTPQILLIDGRNISYERFVKKFYLKNSQYGWLPFKVIDDVANQVSANDIINSAVVVSLGEGTMTYNRIMQAHVCGKTVLCEDIVHKTDVLSELNNIYFYKTDIETAVSNFMDLFLSGIDSMSELTHSIDKTPKKGILRENQFMAYFETTKEAIKQNRIDFINAVNAKKEKTNE